MAVVLFTRDLRVHDNPALAAAARAGDAVVPLFVLDATILGSGFAAPNRMRFLRDCLTDLRRTLRRLGGDLILRHGDPVDEAVGLAAGIGAVSIHMTADVSGYARRRESRLPAACARSGVGLHVHEAATIVAPDDLHTTAGPPYQVFTPYWRAWRAAPRRAIEAPLRSLRLPGGGLRVGQIPGARVLASGTPSPHLLRGGRQRRGHGSIGGCVEEHSATRTRTTSSRRPGPRSWARSFTSGASRPPRST